MLSFTAPYWLFGLALLPALRWLHRTTPGSFAIRVSRLALWRSAAAASHDAGGRLPPDPAWRRRGLIATLLIVALAGPHLGAPSAHVTLWIDDSSSMLVRDANGTRLEQGLKQAQAELAAEKAAVEVRTLSNPWRIRGTLDEPIRREIVDQAGREPVGIPRSLWERGTANWLVTDGADPTLMPETTGLSPDRLILIGTDARNVGIERLAARRRLDDPENYELLLKVTNGGNALEERDVVFTAGTGNATHEVARSHLRLERGESKMVEVVMPAASAAGVALAPGDDLPADDRVSFDLAGLLRLSVIIDPTCPSALTAAIRAHPALVVSTDVSRASAAVACGGYSPPTALPVLRFVADGLPTPLSGAPQWGATVDERERVVLDWGGMQAAASLPTEPGDTILLAGGGKLLMVKRTGSPARVDTALDFRGARAARDPGLPLLVNLALEHLLDRNLLDAAVTLDRGRHAARVVPSTAQANVTETLSKAPKIATTDGYDGARPLLVAALAVLLWEFIALKRRRTGVASPAAPAQAR